MKFAIFILTLCFSIACANAQPGCTDPQALNFDAAATQNDGSCSYLPTTYFPEQIAVLPSELLEASGLAFFDQQLWLEQDGGTGPTIFTIDTTTGAVQVSYQLPFFENKDWEDLAEDPENLYIGDFGNNFGDRTDLRIYKVNKNALQLAGTVVPQLIEFSFSDQTDFTPASNATNFDCEAFIVLGDSIHLFSKRWLDTTTHRYTLPTTPGSYTAQLRDSLPTGFLVTAADVSNEGTVLLLGYDGVTSATSMTLLWDYPGTSVFDGNERKISLGTALNMSQAEGITFSSATGGFICSEKILVLPQRLLRFDIGQWVQLPSPTLEIADELGVSISPNPFSEFLNVDFQQVGGGEGKFSLVGTDGQVLRSGKLGNGKNSLDTTGLLAGTYFIWVKNEGGITVRRVVKL
ncbi:MAG: T9SS type A sorting domain-containing protein [Saprospiraceae bacterium]|nr:T9SS type A sorting domain-containing protein [Saprospiraceae bacterium]MCF8250607.1 T9SS type A sorting domain-containing protein [Saprospiraceae bacterium]MCF8281424.1 T9SS type A sorting domain-containing protein [Bacteroidales bacterium]MCF8313073.1 T9SS type A sorting domain-containing protein [Saprospiraceae bacterium]MCF8441562.1 T9SS type A sorting domain-containing protein [Saprospiraceae bacterium]